MENIPGLDRHITSRRDDPFGGCVVSFEDMDDARLRRMEEREEQAREAAIEREERPWMSERAAREQRERWEAEDEAMEARVSEREEEGDATHRD